MSKNFLKIKKIEKDINFGFFTSRGGISKNNFYSLNCSKSSGDYKNNVVKNIEIAKQELKIKNKKLILINQIHSNKVMSINKNNFKRKFYGDALITNQKNFAVGVLTADCAPILLYDIKKKIICAIHSGWKGTLLNIVSTTLKKIKNKNIKSNEIVAIVGPCLGYKNFEVDKSFKLKFIKSNGSYSNYFKSKNKYKDLFNLRGMINFQLKSEGVSNIYNIRRDTYENGHIFFSHRRSSHQMKKSTGRMINIISFK